MDKSVTFWVKGRAGSNSSFWSKHFAYLSQYLQSAMAEGIVASILSLWISFSTIYLSFYNTTCL